MLRALAVISASAWLALAPAALATTHAHKPAHAKHAEAGDAPASKKAKLKRKADAEAPAKSAKGAHAKSKRHSDKVEAGEDAAPAHGSKRHGRAVHEASVKSRAKAARGKHAAAEEEAPAEEAAPSKKRHGKAAVAEAAETRKARSRHGKAVEEEAEADRPGRRHGRVEAVEPVSAVHGGVRSAKACVAAHFRAHGRPKSARARAAVQRECVKEVEAARRKAEEEAMIRTWSAPRGPLIYPGALPRSIAPAAVSEPPPAPAAPAAEAAETAVSGAPAKGEASVQQQAAAPAPTSGGFFGGLFGKTRRAPRPAGPAPTLAALIGSDEARLKAELGEPELMRAEGDGAMWTYRLPGCALYVFLNREAAAAPWKVKGAQTGPLKRGEAAPEVDVCLKGARS